MEGLEGVVLEECNLEIDTLSNGKSMELSLRVHIHM